MVIDKSPMDLEKKLRAEKRKEQAEFRKYLRYDLKINGFECAGGAGGECLTGNTGLLARTIEKYNPREIKLIKEAEFHPSYGKNHPAYYVYYKQYE